MNGLTAERVRYMMAEPKENELISNMLNTVYSYFIKFYNSVEIEIIKNELLCISGKDSFNWLETSDTICTYDDLQNILSVMNEKESIRKSKGVYYTPNDIVKFITMNCFKLRYDKLNTDNICSDDLSDISYQTLCNKKTVFDPTCGAGEFLLTAMELKFDLLNRNEPIISETTIADVVSTIYGNDINLQSTIISKTRLLINVIHRYGAEKCKNLSLILNQNFTNNDFVSKAPDFNSLFDIIIGNPPYVEDSKSGLELSRHYGNIYANVLDNAEKLLTTNGTIGFIIPLSYIATPRMKPIRNELISNIPIQYILSYADRPDCLFTSVHQKLCIILGKKTNGKPKIFTSNYQYWYKNERHNLFKNLSIVKNDFIVNNFIPKLGTQTDVEIYKKIAHVKNGKSLAEIVSVGNATVCVNMRAAFWIKAFLTPHSGSDYKLLTFESDEIANYYSCLVNSSLFWWYWICVSDCWHITNKELTGFKTPMISDYSTVSKLAVSLEKKLEKTKRFVGTKQIDYEYKHRACTDEIHEIDDYINQLYGLSDSESQYIKKFAFRYRVSGGIK